MTADASRGLKKCVRVGVGSPCVLDSVWSARKASLSLGVCVSRRVIN